MSALTSPAITRQLYFSTFLVTPQVFHLTPLTMSLVNLKPLLPGHILVCPIRPVPRLTDLTPPELSDLFSTVQFLTKRLEVIYSANAFNIAIQDGAAAGQSVPHVHAHVIPRKNGDLEKEDEIYELMQGDDADLWKAYRERSGKFPVPEGERKPRGDEEMRREAEWLGGRIKELGRMEEEGQGKL